MSKMIELEKVIRNKKGSKFEFKGETYVINEYGEYSKEKKEDYVHYKSNETEKEVSVVYTMNKVGQDHYSGMNKIKSLIWWENYKEGTVIEEL